MSYNDNLDSGGVVISNDVIASIAANAEPPRGFVVTGTFYGIASRG